MAAAGAIGKSIGATAASQKPAKQVMKMNQFKYYNEKYKPYQTSYLLFLPMV